MVVHITPHDDRLKNKHCLIQAVTFAGYSNVDFVMDVYSHLTIKGILPFAAANAIIHKHCEVINDGFVFFDKHSRILLRQLVLECPAIVLVDNDHYLYSPGNDRYLGYVDKMLSEVVALWKLPKESFRIESHLC